MIKINLLKDDGQRKASRGFPKSLIVIMLSLVLIAAIAVGILKTMENRPKKQLVAFIGKMETTPKAAEVPLPANTSSEPVVPGKPPVSGPLQEPIQPAKEKLPVVEAAPDTLKSNFTPSTHAGTKGIEDVVPDRSAKTGTELVSLVYKEMSQGEKINYEIAFAKKTFELLARAVPEGIGFNSLTIDSFALIRATGVGPDRELVGGLFRSLRDENLALRERPISWIRPAGRQGYRFDFTGDASFGPDTSGTYFATSHLKRHEVFNGMLRTFLKLVSADGIALKGEFDRSSSQKSTPYRRYSYHMSASGTYRNFVKLILDLQKERMPCSFSRIQLRARNDAKIAIEADIVFTLLD